MTTSSATARARGMRLGLWLAATSIPLLLCACPSEESSSDAAVLAPGRDASGPSAAKDGGSVLGPWTPGKDGGPPTSPPETCNGLDDNGNGVVDENVGGAPCEMAGDAGSGFAVCDDGILKCLRCIPGEQKKVDCGCAGLARIDTCNESGRWVQGLCDGCPKTEVPQGCDAPTACRPDGGYDYRLCDTCTGSNCGSQCLASRWKCDENCQWKQDSPCEVQHDYCQGDQESTEPCGACGTRRVYCYKGCFLARGPCMNEGACMPGVKRTVPCLAKGCAEGFTAEAICDEHCNWVMPTTCQGCIPQTFVDADAGCPQRCGAVISRTVCAPEPVTVCSGQASLSQGAHRDGGILLDECPENECQKGAVQIVQNCGCGYFAFKECLDIGGTCTWGPVHECPPLACQPGETKSQECLNGAGTTVATCDGCGFKPGQCMCKVGGAPAECTPGQIITESCSAADGCGKRTIVCGDDCQFPSTAGVGSGGTGTSGPGSVSPCSGLPCDPSTNGQPVELKCCGGAVTKTVTAVCNTANCSMVPPKCPDVCQPNQVIYKPCTTVPSPEMPNGCPGSQKFVCAPDCSGFVPEGPCSLSGTACTLGEKQTKECTLGPEYCSRTGTQTSECKGGCGMVTSTCETPPDLCVKGSMLVVAPGACPCGQDGFQICNDQCTWDPPKCPEAPCQAGLSKKVDCYLCGQKVGYKYKHCDGCSWIDDTDDKCQGLPLGTCINGTTRVIHCPDDPPSGRVDTCVNCQWGGCN